MSDSSLLRRIEELEAELRESQRHYRLLFDGMANGYAECELLRDAEGRAVDFRLLELNPAFENLTGIPVATARGRPASEVVSGLEWWVETFDRIVQVGTAQRVENEVAALGRWYAAFIVPTGGDRCTVSYEDITLRKHAEAALHESQERQAFLLRLSDSLLQLSDAVQIKNVACTLLGRHLGANRTNYFDILGERFVADTGFVDGVAPITSGTVVDFGEVWLGEFRDHEMMVSHDVATDARFSERERANILGAEIGAFIVTMLVLDGRWVAAFAAHQKTPRRWTDFEITLVRDVAERIREAAERARAEAALRESEERFRQFADASLGALWIRSADGLTMEYASRAIEEIYGTPAASILGEVDRWASLVAPEDRQAALEHLLQAGTGCSVVHEFRIRRPADGSIRWIRNTAFPLRDAQGRVQRIGGVAEDVTASRLAVGHQAILVAELQHRVRNIMAVIRSIAARTADGATSVGSYAELLQGRLAALARVQALLTRSANQGVDLTTILRDELSAHAHHEGQYALAGPELMLSPKAAEIMTLAFHELTTNAIKYGALSLSEGRVTVRWNQFDVSGKAWVRVEWLEQGAPRRSADARRRGFGGELIERRIPYELGGRGKLDLESEGGARCLFEFPLAGGASILETDAPAQSIVSAGSPDTAEAAELQGARVLVLEDDYFLAADAAWELRRAGAEVLGPCRSEQAALERVAEDSPTAAVLDINIGAGPSFEVARKLKANGVPFLFLTGYDTKIIPSEFEDVERLQKPVALRDVVRMVGAMRRP